jgi:hypothetical protein
VEYESGAGEVVCSVVTESKGYWFWRDVALVSKFLWVAMGSPISSTIAEIYLQFLEEIYIKQ